MLLLPAKFNPSDGTESKIAKQKLMQTSVSQFFAKTMLAVGVFIRILS